MFAFAFSITFRFPFSPLPHNRDDWAVVRLYRDLWRERKGTFGFARYKETFNVYRKEMTHKAFDSSDRPLKQVRRGDFFISKK